MHDLLVVREREVPAQPRGRRRRTLRVMRLVLEWLGLVRPDRTRKEPVAVPAWAPYAVAAVIAVLATVATALLRLLVDASI